MKLKWIWLSNLRIWPGNPILFFRGRAKRRELQQSNLDVTKSWTRRWADLWSRNLRFFSNCPNSYIGRFINGINVLRQAKRRIHNNSKIASHIGWLDWLLHLNAICRKLKEYLEWKWRSSVLNPSKTVVLSPNPNIPARRHDKTMDSKSILVIVHRSFNIIFRRKKTGSSLCGGGGGGDGDATRTHNVCYPAVSTNILNDESQHEMCTASLWKTWP